MVAVVMVVAGKGVQWWWRWWPWWWRVSDVPAVMWGVAEMVQVVIKM